MEMSLLLSFAFIQFTLSVIPGPAVLITSSAALRSGMGAGLRAACGVLTGNAVYVLVACLGVGTLLASVPGALKAINLIGAAWLAWLALRTLYSTWRQVPGPETASVGESTRGSPFKSALLTQLSNPKSILFFGAMLPQFVSPSGWAPPVQMLTLGAVGLVLELPVLLLYAGTASLAGRAHQGQALWLERGGAVVLLAAAGAAALR